ncbi:MAG: RNA methyltransferase [Fibrobacter sp.]|nr:RNA methyltransferase [Fibrobacter sp.]
MDSSSQKTAFEKRLKRQVIGKPRRFLAIAPLGFEQTLVQELDALGIQATTDESGSAQAPNRPHIIADGKVEFTAKITEAWKAVAYSRIANRILMHIADFHAENFRELEKKAAEIPWELYLPSGPVTPDTVSIHVTCKHSRLYHSDAIAERLYKVISACPAPSSSWTRSIQDPYGSDPHLSKEAAPKQNLFVTLIDNRCTIWLDLAGEELYKRGQERFVNDAPLKETIAAAMLFESFRMVLSTSPSHISHSTSHTPHYTLFDLMAGSGTFSLEAAYIANGLIPGKCRDFALKHQPAFKEATWNHIINEASLRGNEVTAAITNPRLNILTSDISPRAIEIIRHNVQNCPLAQFQASEQPATIDPQQRDFFTYTAQEIAEACSINDNASSSATNGSQPAILLNPPYGKRLDFDAPKLYTKIGKKLTELARELEPFGKKLSVAIIAPKDDSRPGSNYTCTTNLLRECPALDPARNPQAKRIETSHGGLGLNVFITLF